MCVNGRSPAHNPLLVRKVPHATTPPSAVATATCESPVEMSTAAAPPGMVTRPGVLSAFSSSLFALRPRAQCPPHFA